MSGSLAKTSVDMCKCEPLLSKETVRYACTLRKPHRSTHALNGKSPPYRPTVTLLNAAFPSPLTTNPCHSIRSLDPLPFESASSSNLPNPPFAIHCSTTSCTNWIFSLNPFALTILARARLLSLRSPSREST